MLDQLQRKEQHSLDWQREKEDLRELLQLTILILHVQKDVLYLVVIEEAKGEVVMVFVSVFQISFPRTSLSIPAGALRHSLPNPATKIGGALAIQSLLELSASTEGLGYSTKMSKRPLFCLVELLFREGRSGPYLLGLLRERPPGPPASRRARVPITRCLAPCSKRWSS